jgi:hypothetical protein
VFLAVVGRLSFRFDVIDRGTAVGIGRHPLPRSRLTPSQLNPR